MVFPALAIALLALRYGTEPSTLSFNFILNCSYVLILVGILMVYFRIRSGSWKMIDQGLGAGDLVFWLVVCLLPEFYLFLIWFNVSIILALVIHLVLRNREWYGNANKIPLAGLQAVVLIIFILIDP